MIDEQRLKAGADAVLGKAVARGYVPGVVAAATTAGGTIYESAHGLRAIGGSEPMTLDTVFNVASLTKAVASCAIMLLVERGELDLDMPLGGIIPYLGEIKVVDGFGADGKPLLRNPARPLTTRHLLTHTAGFGYTHWSAMWKELRGHYPARLGTVESLRMPLMFDPGTRWTYGIGMDWAAQVVEAVSGTTLEQFLRVNLFTPLGMTATWHPDAEMQSRRASVHRRAADGTLAPDPLGPHQADEYESGGHGIHTTVPDYLKFCRMILNRGAAPDGTRVLSEQTIALMQRPDAAPNTEMTTLLSTDPRLTNEGIFFPGLPKRHGLGFMITEAEAPTGRSAGSLAWAGFLNCYYWIDPKKDVAGVYMTQIMPFMDHQSLPLFHAFETAVYDAIS